jgi:hypothetical protein
MKEIKANIFWKKIVLSISSFFLNVVDLSYLKKEKEKNVFSFHNCYTTRFGKKSTSLNRSKIEFVLYSASNNQVLFDI